MAIGTDKKLTFEDFIRDISPYLGEENLHLKNFNSDIENIKSLLDSTSTKASKYVVNKEEKEIAFYEKKINKINEILKENNLEEINLKFDHPEEYRKEFLKKIELVDDLEIRNAINKKPARKLRKHLNKNYVLPSEKVLMVAVGLGVSALAATILSRWFNQNLGGPNPNLWTDSLRFMTLATSAGISVPIITPVVYNMEKGLVNKVMNSTNLRSKSIVNIMLPKMKKSRLISDKEIQKNMNDYIKDGIPKVNSDDLKAYPRRTRNALIRRINLINKEYKEIVKSFLNKEKEMRSKIHETLKNLEKQILVEKKDPKEVSISNIHREINSFNEKLKEHNKIKKTYGINTDVSINETEYAYLESLDAFKNHYMDIFNKSSAEISEFMSYLKSDLDKSEAKIKDLLEKDNCSESENQIKRSYKELWGKVDDYRILCNLLNCVVPSGDHSQKEKLKETSTNIIKGFNELGGHGEKPNIIQNNETNQSSDKKTGKNKGKKP